MRIVDDLPQEAAAEGAIEVRPVGLDDFAHARYVHSTAFRLLVAPFVEDAALKAASERFQGADYTDDLMAQDLQAAWVGEEMVGTAGWITVDDHGRTARITSVFVRPLFTGLGIGRRLVAAAEARARLRGFTEFSVRTLPSTAGFYSRLGYEITSHGATVAGGENVPLAFMRKREARSSRPASEVELTRGHAITAAADARNCVARIMADAAATAPSRALKYFRH